MATITIPIWALTAAIGLPTTCLIWIVAILIRRRRKGARAAAHAAHSPALQGVTLPNRFRDDLLVQQIDIIFNGITALIETERIKLQSLFNQGLSQAVTESAPAPAAADLAPASDLPAAPETENGTDIGRQVADAVAGGSGAEDIASQLGLSHAEVALAMKLNQSRTQPPHRKLEAVA